MLKKLLAVSAATLLTLASYVAAVELRDDHPDTYVVQKGDTLWDIAARFLNEPWLWPEIWQANPQVENPHLIYPGDVLSLAYLGERGPVVRLSPSARRTGKPVDALPLSEIEPFLRKAHVLDPDAYKSMPYIVGLEESRLRSAEGQLVYARNGQFAPGQTWAIVRPTLAYSSHVHRRSRGAELKREPWNSTTGREGRNEGFEWAYHVPESHPRYVLGYEVLEVTQAVVTREGDPATLLITPGGREAKVGDLLMPYDPQPYDLTFYPRAMDAIPADMRILAQTDRLLYGGPRDVVALSAGAADGVENGHVFAIYRPGELVEDRVAVKQPINRKLRKNKVQLPDEFVGHVMVFRTFDRISYGLIMDGVRAVRLDDKLKSPERR